MQSSISILFILQSSKSSILRFAGKSNEFLIGPALRPPSPLKVSFLSVRNLSLKSRVSDPSHEFPYFWRRNPRKHFSTDNIFPYFSKKPTTLLSSRDGRGKSQMDSASNSGSGIQRFIPLQCSIRSNKVKTSAERENTLHDFPCSPEKSTTLSSTRDGRNKTQMDFTLNNQSGISKSVHLRSSSIWDNKDETFLEREASLLDFLKLVDFVPTTRRRFWRVSMLQPQDVLEILISFEKEYSKVGIEVEKVEALWKLFTWAANQTMDFIHLPQSHEIMVLMLIQAGLLKNAESLLEIMKMRGFLLVGCEFHCEIIKRYVDACELESSIEVYNRARDLGSVMSKSCYQDILNLLVRMEERQLAWRVYADMIEAGCASSVENPVLEFIIGNLCRNGQVQDARYLLKKVMYSGIEPTHVILNDIANGYCEKKDFDDLFNFLNEHKYAPAALLCNKIISSQCRNLSTEGTLSFLQKLETLGFMPNEITYGVLINLSCQKGNLKNAFVYVSDLLSRNLIPSVNVYNALISGVFKEGMGGHAKEIFYDMVEKGITPDLSTFTILLAGYCKERKFDEVRMILCEMERYSLVSLSPLEDMLSKAFMVLGLGHLGVKVKRDNSAGSSREEFFDTLGNGLYLDTDLDEYEKTITGILDDLMIPNFNLVVTKECIDGNIEAALRAKNEMVQWGQKLSLSSYSKLLECLCSSESHVMEAIELFEEMVEWSNQLDQASLNLLIQAIIKKGMIYKAWLILDRMLQRELYIENKTFTLLILGFWKERNVKRLKACWELAWKRKWSPEPEDCKPLLSCLCKTRMFNEVLELFDSMVENYPYLISDTCNTFMKELCVTGFTSIGCILVEEVTGRGLVLNHATYNHLIRGFCRERRFLEAFAMFNTMLEKNMAPHINLPKSLIHYVCKFNKMEKTMGLLRWILLREQSSTATSAHKVLPNELYILKDVFEASLQLQQILMKGVHLDQDTFNLMLCGFCHENNLSRACELLGVMLKMNVSISLHSYRNLVRLMCMQSQVHNALRLKDVMLRESRLPQLVLYNILIFRLFQVGCDSVVAKLIDEMHERCLMIDQVTYNFLIYGYYLCKNASKSVEILNTMIDKNLRPNNRSFRLVIDYLCSHGTLEKALEWSRLMEFRGLLHSSAVQNALVLCLVSCNRLGEAEIFLSRMEKKCLIPNNINYDVLIKQFCGYGSLDVAIELLNMMLKNGNLPSDISYNEVIRGCCTYKELDRALDFHSEMLHKNMVPSIKSCDALVHGLCLEGRAHEAERILGIMLQVGQTPTRNMYQSVIDRYSINNNLQKVSELLHQMQCSGYIPDFKTHWSLISNLSDTDVKDNSNSNSFLSELLSHSGFPVKDSKAKRW